MEALEVTKLSSKGQVVLPQAIREKFHLASGAKFIVIGGGDVIILKMLEMPEKKQLKSLLQVSRAYARKVGLKRTDISKIVQRTRAKMK